VCQRCQQHKECKEDGRRASHGPIIARADPRRG
jgi:hypothetical protein